MKTLKTLFEYALVAICVLCVAGCQSDEYTEPETEKAKEPGLYLCLNTLGGDSGLSTRAMGSDDTYVKDFCVLYFKGTAGGTDAQFTYVEMETITVGSSQNDFTTAQEFKLKPPTAGILPTGQAWRVVFIANTNPAPVGNPTLEAFIKTPKVSSSDVLWLGTNELASGIDYIPMYYCTKDVYLPDPPYNAIYYINDNSGEPNTKPQTHNLLRMMAKFTITNNKLTSLTNELSDFKITEMYVMNGYKEGMVCYNSNYWEDSQGRVNLPTLPAPTPASTSASQKITIDPWTSNKQAITFYTFERDVKSGSINNIVDNCYIKLVGERTDLGGATTTNVSYMLPVYDIVYNTTTEACDPDYTKPGPILRNHWYNYSITGVHLYSLRVKLSVTPWSEVRITNADPIPLR